MFDSEVMLKKNDEMRHLRKLTVCTLCLWVAAVCRNHWSEPCCTGSACLLDEESSAWAGWTQCDCDSETDTGKNKSGKLDGA